MAFKVFFSFHYNDVSDLRANVVRNHWLTKSDREAAGFFDASLWESVKKTGDLAIKRLINSGLEGTSVTCVLIGSETFLRPWVRYEILKSYKRGNRIIGVHINSIRGRDQKTKPLGPSPLDYLGVSYSSTGDTTTLYEHVNNGWQEYAIGDSASYRKDGVPSSRWNKGFKLSGFFPVYDWIAHNGYSNFSSWIA